MLTRFNLFIIAFAIGIVIFLTQTKSLKVAKFVDSQDLRNGAVNTVLLPKSSDIEEPVAPNDDVLNMYRGIDPVLELNEASPFYIAHPEFTDIQNSIVKKNPPMPVVTSVTV